MKDKIKLEAELIEVKENIKNTYARVYKDRYAPHRNREDMIELKKLLMIVRLWMPNTKRMALIRQNVKVFYFSTTFKLQ